jgi:hypothetical protein
MTVNRVVIGQQLDGSYGLRVSLPGVDALYGNSAPPDTFAFDSAWTDMARVHQISIVPGLNGQTFPQTLFPALGYKPFVELRQFMLDGSGGLLDDTHSDATVGIPAVIEQDRLRWALTPINPAITALAVIYRIPVVTQ